MKDKIPVHIVNKNAFIWDPEDVIILRTKYRIVGSLVGLLPKNPLQNIFSSLPLLLLPEEVSLLLEKGFIYLIDDKKSHLKPSSSDIKVFNDEQQKLKDEDNLKFMKQKKEHLQRNLNKNKSENNVNVNNSNVDNSNDNNNANTMITTNTGSDNVKENGNDGNSNADSGILNKNNSTTNNSGNDGNDTTKKKNKTKEKSQLVHIQTSSKNLPWYQPSNNNHQNECFTLEEAKSKNIWTFPETPKECQKYKIFCDIWEKPENYFITSGSKYGSDYLIYPGDPVQYHSNFIATVIYDTDFEYSPNYIIKYGRLGTNVKKTHLLCNIDKKTNQINYYSIEWSSWI